MTSIDLDALASKFPLVHEIRQFHRLRLHAHRESFVDQNRAYVTTTHARQIQKSSITSAPIPTKDPCNDIFPPQKIVDGAVSENFHMSIAKAQHAIAQHESKKEYSQAYDTLSTESLLQNGKMIQLTAHLEEARTSCCCKCYE